MLTAESFANDVLADFGLIRRATVNETTPAPVRWGFSDPIAFIEKSFFIPERKDTNNPAMQLEPYQRAVIREAYRTDPATGKFVYDLVLWSDIKKSAKSSIAAAIVLHRALETEWGSFKIVANDLRQANSRVFYYIQRALSLNPELGKRANVRNYKISLDNHSIIEAVPVDPGGEAGGTDDLIEWTELHAADSKAAQAMWTEMTISPTKHGYSQRFCDTYAGFSGQSPILEGLYDRIVKHGTRLTLPDAPDDLEVFANGRMLALWNAKPRLPWQTSEYYASEANILLPNEYRRIHQNEWVTSEDVFVPRDWWRACKGDIPAFDNRIPVVVACDAGVSNDCFAIVGVSRINETIYVRFARVWKPPANGSIDFAEIERTIREEIVKQYNVVQISYDNYQLHQMSSALARDQVAWMYDFSQGTARLIADKALYDRIRERSIVHDGNADLTEHITNANAKIDSEESRLRIVKRAAHLKVDLAVALSMACSEAARLNIA